MDSVKRSSVTPKKSRIARTVGKVLHFRTATGIAPVDSVQKVEAQDEVKDEKISSKSVSNWLDSFDTNDAESKKHMALEVLTAKLFASVSSIKAAYAQMQYCQSPYDADGIQTADQLVVSELKNLTEFKRCYVKKQLDFHPETTMLKAEVQEMKSLSKTYEIMGKKLESQLRLKDSEIVYLKEKMEEVNKQNKQLEKRLNQSGQLSMPDNLHQAGLSPSHFIMVLRHTVKSIRSFVKVMINDLRTSGWDLDAAVKSIAPGVVYWREDDKCFAFESFVCREMFNSFHLPYFSLLKEPLPPEKKSQQRQLFFRRFTEMKSVKAKECLLNKPKSTFARFCRAKYLQLVHPKMDMALSGNSSQRDFVSSGQFPDNTFFASFAEMAKWVWLLHCMAHSFQPEALIFQVEKGCRFSEVYMECVSEDALISWDNAPEADPPVAFTVVPGFRIGKTVIQCQVYLPQVQK